MNLIIFLNTVFVTVYAQSFNDVIEDVYKDGNCQDVNVVAMTKKIWGPAGITVHFTVTEWSNMFLRRARFINDWSRLVFGMQWKNKITNEYVQFKEPLNLSKNKFIDAVDKKTSIWRFMFKDGESMELSSMAQSEGKIEFTIWIPLMKSLPKNEWDSDFDLDISDPQLCDGGYEKELVITKHPEMPDQCTSVNKLSLNNYYTAPVDGERFASLDLKAENGVFGCEAYVIVGLDAPRTTISKNLNYGIQEATPLTDKLKPCSDCTESAFWKLTLDPKRVQDSRNFDLQIEMRYFGSEEQAPVAFFLYNCDYNKLSTCASGGQYNAQNGQADSQTGQVVTQNDQSPNFEGNQNYELGSQSGQSHTYVSQSGQVITQNGQDPNTAYQSGQENQSGPKGQNDQSGQGTQSEQNGEANQNGQNDQSGQGTQSGEYSNGNQDGQNSEYPQSGQNAQSNENYQIGQGMQTAPNEQSYENYQIGQGTQGGQNGQGNQYNNNEQAANKKKDKKNKDKYETIAYTTATTEMTTKKYTTTTKKVTTTKYTTKKPKPTTKYTTKKPKPTRTTKYTIATKYTTKKTKPTTEYTSKKPKETPTTKYTSTSIDWTPLELNELLEDFASNAGAYYSGVARIGDLDGYGCICQGLDLSKKIKGKAVDEVDSACYRWRRCMTCVYDNVGGLCGGYQLNKNKICSNTVGSCQRASCECDFALFKSLVSAEYDSNNKNYDSSKCKKSTKPGNTGYSNTNGNNGSDSGPSINCCENKDTSLFTFYNHNTHSCCTNGSTAPIGTCY